MQKITNREKMAILKAEPPKDCCLADYYYALLERLGEVKVNYNEYTKSTPIDCDEELRRLHNADYEHCCALLTLLLREDHFLQFGCFNERYKRGDVRSIIERMIRLLEEKEQKSKA